MKNDDLTFITLSISNIGSSEQPTYSLNLFLNQEVIAGNQSLTQEESEQVRDISRKYNEFFEGEHAPNLAMDNLKVIGSTLFQLWLSKFWKKIKMKIPAGSQRAIVIASDSADVLNLPWELLRPPDGDFIGLDGKFSIRRSPRTDANLPAYSGALRARPLRVLFMACSPRDQLALDYEREEETLLRIIAKAGQNATFDCADLGSFDELRDRIGAFEPHVVHLTGHGIVQADGLGYFCFEDERGKTDLRSSEEIRQMMAGSGVECAFVSGCQTGKAPPIAAIGGICQGLVSEEIPMAIGWAASVADDIATDFASVFYNGLAVGQPVNRALTQARQAILKQCTERGYPGWTLPVLYSATTQERVVDPDPKRPEEPPLRASLTQMQQPLPGMIEGYAEHFVGRRREIQSLLPPLTEGTIQIALLTGIGGAGKSTLATRLARKLEAAGFTPIPIPSTEETPLSASRLLQACGDAFLVAGMRDGHAILNDSSVAVDGRLRYIVSALNRARFCLVLDNFEVNLDAADRKILDVEVAAFYVHLLSNLVGGSRALITSRYQPADVPILPKMVAEENLEDFPESSFFKFLLRDEVVEERYYSNELPHELLSELRRLLGGTPRFLTQIREVLKTITPDELTQELEAIELPDTIEKGKLRELRDEYCERIFASRLYGNLSTRSRRALSCAALYNIPVNLAALAAVTGESLELVRKFTHEWQDFALAYPERNVPGLELWTCYGLLRSWLVDPERLPVKERYAAQHAAGEFLMELEHSDRERELGIFWVNCLIEARTQFLASMNYEDAALATNRISGFFVRSGLYGEVTRLNHDLLSYGEDFIAMSWLGRAYLDQGDYPQAEHWYRRALGIAGGEKLINAAIAWHGLASIDLDLGKYDDAREKLQKTLALREQIGDRAGEAAAWHQLATLDVRQGEYDQAQKKYERALEIRKDISDPEGEAAALHGLASIDLNFGKHDAARMKLEKVLEITQKVGDRASRAAALHQLASIDLNLGNFDAALKKSQESLRITREVGDRGGEGAALHLLATIDLRQGKFAESRHKFQQSLQVRQQTGDPVGMAACFYQLGVLAVELGRPTDGISLIALCYVIDKAIGYADTENDFETLRKTADALNYSEKELEDLLKRVSEAYETDRGKTLAENAFAE